MYAAGPSEAELEAIGIKAEDIEDTSVTEIWPESRLPFQVFQRLGTQWITGMGGPTGLNHASIPVWLDAMGIKKKKWFEIMDAVGVMEREALRQMSSQR